jgi:FKBP-type peptidyl-prolyl cis-trans isomerase 2
MPVKAGDTVKVHYTLKDANGEIVETSINSEPIDFIIGKGNVIPGFEKAVTGMELNEKKSIEITPEDAYGPHDENKVFEYDRSKAPKDFNPQIGQTVQLHRPNGNTVMVTVLGETEKGFRMDANHPLAGKKLDFDVELVEIVSK